MMKFFRSVTALVLSVLCVFMLFPTVSFAGGAEAGVASAEVVLCSGTVSTAGPRTLTDAYLNGAAAASSNDPLPARYDGRDYGYVPPIREQYWTHGTCWVFAAIACVECNLIKNGVINPETGNPATTSDVDLSETALAYFHFSDAHDKLGMLEGDRSIPLGLDYLRNCDLGSAVALTLMRWTGPVSETYPAVNNNSNLNATGISAEYGCNYDFAHVESVEWIPMSDREAIKRAIMEYGAATVGLTVDPSYVNYDTDGYYFPQKAASSRQIDHFLAIVGWDDNFPTSSFSRYASPSQSGAWICKNSQGRFSPTDDNYLYVSYEDYFMSTDTCYFYKVGNLDNYQYNYQYDGTCNDASYLGADNGVQIANVFTANGHETMKAAAVNILDKGTSYTLDVYKNPSSRNPSSGTKVSSQTGSFDYPGYYTVPLNVPVELNAGDTFSVVFTLHSSAESSSDGKAVHLAYDCSASVDHVQWVHVDRGDTSFYKTSGGTWTDCPNCGDFRIKAYNDDYVYTATYTVNAESANEAFGTVSVSGSVIAASPADGYYVSGCEVYEGTATFTIDGNTILVSPESDCSVRVFFAPSPTCTINYVACGACVGSQSAVVNSTISLPTAVAQTPDGCTFCGWTLQPVEQTTEVPACYAPGAAYPVQNNATLYALYTFTEGNSEVGFQLLTEAPASWDGNYVITSAGTDMSSIHVLKGAAGTAGISKASFAPTLSGAGMVLNQDLLTNVDPLYQFSIFSNGSYYRIQNVSTGTYIGGTTTMYAMASSDSSYLNWSMGFNSNGSAKMLITYKGTYLNYDAGKGFFNGTSSVNSTIRLWREAPVGSTYYSTMGSWTPPHTHVIQYVDRIAPTCTEPGQSAYYYCSAEGCPLDGMYFYDEALSAEALTLTIPALEHLAGEPVEENRVEPTETTEGGYDTVLRCTRCQAVLSSTHTTLPALPVVHTHTLSYVPAVSPTCVELGHTAYYSCTGCGKFFSDESGQNEISLEEAVLQATGIHIYGAAVTNNNGTHTRTCSICATLLTEACIYTEVVTPPTATEEGYTTHTCKHCGDSFKDTYVPATGETCTVSFSVPDGIPPIPSVRAGCGSIITLPTADAPEGCVFIGWVENEIAETSIVPSNVLTVSCSVTETVQLHALYSYCNEDSTSYQRLTAAPSDWSGNYVITCNAANGSVYVLNALSGNKRYESVSCGGTKLLSEVGILVDNDRLSNVPRSNIFKVSSVSSNYYSIQSTSSNTYVSVINSYLSSRISYHTTYCRWKFSVSNGSVIATTAASTRYPYLSFASKNFFAQSTSAPSNIFFWKECSEAVPHYSTFPA